MTQNAQKNKNNTNQHQTLSKSRFKILIDQIERRLNQVDPPTDHDESYISASSTFHFVKRNRMLPKYLNSSRPQSLDNKNQKKISVNLEFNKLLLHEKKKFVEHSPNDKDLMVNLPQIKIQSKPKLKIHKNHPFDSISPRWRLKPLVIQRMMLLTETQPEGQFKRNNKWANLHCEQEKNNQRIEKVQKAEVTKRQNIKFREINSQQDILGQKVPGRFSHKEKRRWIGKKMQKLQVLQEKQNIKLELKTKTSSSTVLSRLKLKVLNYNQFKMSQTQSRYQAI